MLEHDPDLVLPPFDESYFVPRVLTLADEFQSRRRGFAAVHRDSTPKLLFLVGQQRSVCFCEIGLGYVTRGRHHLVREVAVVGKQQQSFAGVVEASYGIEPFVETFEKREYGGTSFRVVHCAHDVFRFVESKIEVVLGSRKNAAIDLHFVHGQICFGA